MNTSQYKLPVSLFLVCLFASYSICFGSTYNDSCSDLSGLSPEYVDLPLGWICEVKKYGGEALSISQGLYVSSAVFWVDWGDGSAPAAYRGSQNFSHVYQDSGIFQVEVYICEDYVRTLSFRHQHILKLDISRLTHLYSLRADKQGKNTAIHSGVGREMKELILPLDRIGHPLSSVRVDVNTISNPLDFSGFPELYDIWISYNLIPSLDLTDLPKLTGINASFNKIEGIIDLTQSLRIKSISFSGSKNHNDTSKDDVIILLPDSLPHLKTFSAYHGRLGSQPLNFSTADSLTKITIRGTKLAGLYLPQNRSNHPLNYLRLDVNAISNPLDVSGFPNLDFLWLNYNQVPSIQVDHLPKLRTFKASFNRFEGDIDLRQSSYIKTINLSHNPNSSDPTKTRVRLLLPDTVAHLKSIAAYSGNLVDTLNLETADSLSSLTVRYNFLTHIEMPDQMVGWSSSATIHLHSNQLANLDDIVARLHGRVVGQSPSLNNGNIWIAGNPPSYPLSSTTISQLQDLHTTYQWTVAY